SRWAWSRTSGSCPSHRPRCLPPPGRHRRRPPHEPHQRGPRRGGDRVPPPSPPTGQVHRAGGALAAAPTDGPALLPGHHGPGRPLDLVGHPMSLTSRHVTDQDASDETLLHDQPVPGTDMPHEFEGPAPIPAALIRAHVMAGLSLLLVAVAFGLITSWKFHDPEFLGQQDWATWGRTRANHVQGILLAWLVNGFMAFAYFAVPTLTNRPILSERLGW